MTKTTTPTARWDRYDGRWVINGDHLDYPVALKVLLRAGMPHGDAVTELERAHRAAFSAPPAPTVPDVAAGDEVTITITGTVDRVLPDGRIHLSHTGPAPTIGLYIAVDPANLSTTVRRGADQ